MVSTFRRMLLCTIAPLAAILFAGAAQAEDRLALVIGQSAYRAVTPLPNPANDAKMMSRMLGEAGFEVISAADLSQTEMRAAVGDFAARVAGKGPDTIALVFYAGHGLQIDGENYLVPVDVDPKREADIPLQAVRLNDVLNTLGSVPTRMRILMLDACRNNPFPEINKTAGHGLAIVDAKAGAAGTFISYSTSPGAEAEDGSGDNSPYTAALLKVAREPGLSIEEAFKRVRVEVNQATEGRQTPWDSSSLTAAFNFFPGGAGNATPAAPLAQAQKQTVDTWKTALRGLKPETAYEHVVAEDSVEAYEAFIALFAQPPFVTRVRSLYDRRREMIAWETAVLLNTASSYETFLAAFPASDLAATARKLAERMRNRPLPVVAAAPTGPLALAAAGPTCPCSQPDSAPAKKRAEQKSKQKSAATRPSRAVENDPPPRRRPVVIEEEEVVYAPPPRVYGPPVVGGGIVVGPGGPYGRPPIVRPPYGGGYDRMPGGPTGRPPVTGGRPAGMGMGSQSGGGVIMRGTGYGR